MVDSILNINQKTLIIPCLHRSLFPESMSIEDFKNSRPDKYGDERSSYNI
jgi:hypothetical protein